MYSDCANVWHPVIWCLCLDILQSSTIDSCCTYILLFSIPCWSHNYLYDFYAFHMVFSSWAIGKYLFILSVCFFTIFAAKSIAMSIRGAVFFILCIINMTGFLYGTRLSVIIALLGFWCPGNPACITIFWWNILHTLSYQSVYSKSEHPPITWSNVYFFNLHIRNLIFPNCSLIIRWLYDSIWTSWSCIAAINPSVTWKILPGRSHCCEASASISSLSIFRFPLLFLFRYCWCFGSSTSLIS